MSDFWMYTYSGVKFDFLDYKRQDIRIQDIAHQLSMLCRFSGACKRFYSVAEHSVRMAEYAEKWYPGQRISKIALLHDAAEAYTGDMLRGLKRMMGPVNQYVVTQKTIDHMIYEKFGLEDIDERETAEVKKLDNAMLLTEARDLLVVPFTSTDVFSELGGEPIKEIDLSATLMPPGAEAYFRHTFDRLWK